MSSDAFLAFSGDLAQQRSLLPRIAAAADNDIARLAAAGVFIQSVSRFEVYFEDIINEYCRTKVVQLTNRLRATAFRYSLNTKLLENFFISDDDRLFIEKVEKEFAKGSVWTNMAAIGAIDSKLVIGKKDFPKPENILLALFKIGKDNKAETNLATGLSERFRDALDRVLNIRNTIAHDGIPIDWDISDVEKSLKPLRKIAHNLDVHLFGKFSPNIDFNLMRLLRKTTD